LLATNRETGNFPSVAAKTSRFRRVAKWLLLASCALLLIPPLQVALALVVNPPWTPMQIQRKIEGIPAKPVTWTPLEKIPPGLIHFIWASEDQAFFEHGGFDFEQLNKAMAAARKKGGPVRGSSTITMQCARSVYLWQGRSYVRKALEAYYTFWMELLLGKKRILELYLNNIEFGPGIYGVGAASREYFDRTPDALTRSQMIALAAILPNPLKWSPVRPDETVRRKIRRIERLSSRAPFPETELK
jgi:monofunctional biosynthetic peptidoglycan transglycosylase